MADLRKPVDEVTIHPDNLMPQTDEDRIRKAFGHRVLSPDEMDAVKEFLVVAREASRPEEITVVVEMGNGSVIGARSDHRNVRVLIADYDAPNDYFNAYRVLPGETTNPFQLIDLQADLDQDGVSAFQKTELYEPETE